MNRIDLLNKIQLEAVEAAIEAEKSTVCLATGVGKTFVAFKFLYKLVELNKIPPDAEIWLLAETTVRERTFREEADKFNDIYGLHPFEDFDITFMCYQSKPEGTADVIVADKLLFA